MKTRRWQRLAGRACSMRIARRSVLAILASCVFVSTYEVRGQNAFDDADAVLPSGLFGRYFANSDFQGASHARVDADVAFDWDQSGPDPRLPDRRFSVRWEGSLFIQTPGAYRFYAYQAGQTRLVVGDARLSIESPAPRWASTQARDFDFGYAPLRLDYRDTGDRGRIALFWSGPGFGLEAVPASVLFHASASPETHSFARGHDLVRSLRCDRCHAIASDGPSQPAPALTQMAGALDAKWLVTWLQSPEATRAHSRMPSFDWTADEARAIVAFLHATSKRFEPIRRGKNAGDVETGQRLFDSRGCLACHSIDGLGATGPFAGGDLGSIARKRNPEALRNWLVDPASLNVDHRMPVFELSPDEVEHLVAYLSTLDGDAAHGDRETRAASSSETIERGRDLILQANCAACHQIPGIEHVESVAQPLHGERSLDWSRACVGDPHRATRRPGYRLDDQDHEAIRTYVESLPAKPFVPSAYARGADALRRRNCLACHPRGTTVGLARTAGDVSQRHDAFLGLSEMLVPPTLATIGDKLRTDYLTKAVAGEAMRRLPWLEVRMPRFTHTEDEHEALIAYFTTHDRIPPDAPDGEALEPPGDDATPAGTRLVAGQDLVGRGFHCTACHRIGPVAPKDVAPATRGSDLVGLGQRMRRAWFHRWMRAPIRIAPGIEMPAYTEPVPAVLDGRLDQQFEAMWDALNDDNFVPPTVAGVVEQDVVVAPDAPAVVVRDVFANGTPDEGWTPRALAVGLNNRHNLLVDLETFGVRMWWYGDFARQRTRGKTWFWEPAGTTLFSAEHAEPSLALFRNGAWQRPVRERQTVGWLRDWQRPDEGDGVAFSYTLRFPDELWLDVHETIRPHASGSAGTGVLRTMLVRGLPPDTRAFWLHHGRPDADAAESPNIATFDTPIGPARLQHETNARPNTESPEWQTVAIDDLTEHTIATPLFSQAAPGEASATVSWSIGLRLDAPARPTPAPLPRKPQQLDVLEGFEVVRLPLDDHIMPTALAWRDDGRMVICSLRGDVLIAHDTDADGFEDALTPFADHLAAPFGLLVDGDDLLVSHKPEVVRLIDKDGDGRADESEVVATGWGYTDNYHDWTIGLVRDRRGNLVVALGSDYQQTGRPQHTTRYRGHALRIAPDGTVTSIATGLRFACGIASNAAGDIFFTDNQGVQNPFNEINHLVEGGFYGVPGLHDPRPTPAPTPASIQVQHPATRSVNGMVFIPPASESFAEFADQGIGCEYDLKALIRFSTQKVGDTFQGATYPFSRPMASYDRRQRSRTDPRGMMGTMTAGFSPAGDLYVGTFLDSGWLGGPNRGAVVRIRRSAELPCGIREVRASAVGFDIDFTQPVDVDRAADPRNYTVSAYRRIWEGGYATPDRDRHSPGIERVIVSEDGRRVRLALESLRPGFVFDLAVRPISPDATPLWPSTAHYTLNTVPADR